jgi:positive regulator of sigma E activity
VTDGGDLAAIAGAIGGLLGGLAWARRYSRRHEADAAFQPVVLRRDEGPDCGLAS